MTFRKRHTSTVRHGAATWQHAAAQKCRAPGGMGTLAAILPEMYYMYIIMLCYVYLYFWYIVKSNARLTLAVRTRIGPIVLITSQTSLPRYDLFLFYQYFETFTRSMVTG